MSADIADSSAPANGGKSTPSDQPLRRIPAKKVALFRRQMDGAEKRIIRLETERQEIRAYIRGKYIPRYNENREIVGKISLSPVQVDGLRLKRTEVENSLAVARRDYFRSKREYRNAVRQNTQVGRKTGAIVRNEIRIERASKKLLNQTKAALIAHGQNGGAEKFNMLTKLAIDGDVKCFRDLFDKTVEPLDPSLYTTISGVSQVKTEIIHEMMDILADEAQEDGTQGAEPATK